MSTLCIYDATTHLLLTLLVDLLVLFSFLTSHPLHLAYLFLLTPHIFPILSFLFPLLLSTSLLILLTLLISSPCADGLFSISSDLPCNAFHAILGILTDRFDGGCAVGFVRRSGPVVLASIDDMVLCSQAIEGLLGDGLLLWDFGTNDELYKEPSLLCADRKFLSEETEQNEVFLGGLGETGGAELEYKVAADVTRETTVAIEEAELECKVAADVTRETTVVIEEAELECKVAEDVSKATSENSENPASDLGVSEVPGRMLAHNLVGCLSRSTSTRATTKKEHLRTASVGGLQQDGSMRKEREWKRTLACKLYEERITFKLCEELAVADKGGEEMDLLWEAYEDDANNKNDSKPKEKKREKKEEVDDDGEEDDGTVEKMCCLQAFRLSAGKMNLGVGGPNLAKVSKVLKGIGLFQKVGRRSRNK